MLALAALGGVGMAMSWYLVQEIAPQRAVVSLSVEAVRSAGLKGSVAGIGAVVLVLFLSWLVAVRLSSLCLAFASGIPNWLVVGFLMSTDATRLHKYHAVLISYAVVLPIALACVLLLRAVLQPMVLQRLFVALQHHRLPMPLILRALVVILALVFTAIGTWISILGYWAFLPSANDLGMYDQLHWSMFHYRPFHTTLFEVPFGAQLSRFEDNYHAEHFMPILLLTSLVYLFAPHPITLLVIHVAALGAAIPVLWFLVRRITGSDAVAIGFSTALALHPLYQVGALMDFYPDALVPLLLFSAFLALEQGNKVLYTLFLLLAMTCKEDVAIWLLLFAVFLGFARRSPRLGFLTGALATIYFLGLATPVMHGAVAGSGEPLIRHIHRYNHLMPEGIDAPSSALRMGLTIVSSPEAAVSHLVDSPQLSALAQVLIPVGIIALLYPPAWIAVVPVTLAHLMSNWPAQSRLEMYHALGILPWIFLASLYSLEPLRRWLHARRALGFIREYLTLFVTPLGWRRALATFMVVTCLLLYLHVGAFPGGGRFQGWPSAAPLASEVADILSLVPTDARVAATTNLVPRLSQRPRIYMLPDFPKDVEYVVIGLRGRTNPVSPLSLQQLIEYLNRHPDWMSVQTSPKTGTHLFRLRSELPSEQQPYGALPPPFTRQRHSVERN